MATAAAAALRDRDPARIDPARPLPAVQACCVRTAPEGCSKKAWAGVGARSAHVSISIATGVGPAGLPRADLTNGMLPVRVGGELGGRISGRIGRVGRLIQQHGQLSRHTKHARRRGNSATSPEAQQLSDDNAGSDTVDTGSTLFCLMSVRRCHTFPPPFCQTGRLRADCGLETPPAPSIARSLPAPNSVSDQQHRSKQPLL